MRALLQTGHVPDAPLQPCTGGEIAILNNPWGGSRLNRRIASRCQLRREDGKGWVAPGKTAVMPFSNDQHPQRADFAVGVFGSDRREFDKTRGRGREEGAERHVSG